jgi:condensin-2 complex subunit H2
MLQGVLEHITFSFDGGPSLNFAEGPLVPKTVCEVLCQVQLAHSSFYVTAALLIQGSACVYSKKVEHLHTLVHQALHFIVEKR